MYELMWFFGGILTYKILAFLLNYGRMLIFAKEVTLLGITLLATIADDLVIIKRLKYELLEETGVDEESAKLFKIADEKMMEAWKEVVILKYKSIWPKRYYSAAPPEVWEEAMNTINQQYKAQIWETK